MCGACLCRIDFNDDSHSLFLVYVTGSNVPLQTTCVFPFTYLGAEITRCADHTDGSGLWCAYTEDFDRDQLWGYCSEGESKSMDYVVVETVNPDNRPEKNLPCRVRPVVPKLEVNYHLGVICHSSGDNTEPKPQCCSVL